MPAESQMTEDLKRTPLHALHVRLGGRMVEFGGYDMPVQYPEGIMAEHNWTRAHAGLFDVSDTARRDALFAAAYAQAAAGDPGKCEKAKD